MQKLHAKYLSFWNYAFLYTFELLVLPQSAGLHGVSFAILHLSSVPDSHFLNRMIHVNSGWGMHQHWVRCFCMPLFYLEWYAHIFSGGNVAVAKVPSLSSSGMLLCEVLLVSFVGQ